MKGKRLLRQIKSVFGDEAILDRIRASQVALLDIRDEKARRELMTFIENVPAFFSSIDIYYEQLDDRANLAQQSMEMSSQELAESHARLTQLNRMLEMMVNSLGQGFFLFDRSGFCLPFYSKACESLLDKSPSGLHVGEVLAVKAEERETFNDWVNLLFEDIIEFDDLTRVGPKFYPHSHGRVVSLEFRPLRDQDGRVEMILVMATDKTAESKAKLEAQKMHAFATLMVAIVQDKDRFRRFVAAVREIFREIYANMKKPEFTQEALTEVKRHLHTLKGAAGSFGVLHLQEAAHGLETRLNAENDLKLLFDILDKAIPVLDGMFEGLLDEHREILAEVLYDREPSRTTPISTLIDIGERLKAVNTPAAKRLYYDYVDEVIAVPLTRIFTDFDPVMKQVAEKLGKKIDPIKFIGDDISVMPESINAFRSALIHVFRNIVDHGIEHEIIRDQRGKPPAGQVTVEFRQLASEKGPYVRIIINDDGNGIDIWQIRNKMEKKGLAIEGLSQNQLLNKIFDAGFSTASAVTEFSGRGVGLDAVRTEVERLGGSIGVTTELGKGSAFVIELPLDDSGPYLQFRSRTDEAA